MSFFNENTKKNISFNPEGWVKNLGGEMPIL